MNVVPGKFYRASDGSIWRCAKIGNAEDTRPPFDCYKRHGENRNYRQDEMASFWADGTPWNKSFGVKLIEEVTGP